MAQFRLPILARWAITWVRPATKAGLQRSVVGWGSFLRLKQGESESVLFSYFEDPMNWKVVLPVFDWPLNRV